MPAKNGHFIILPNQRRSYLDFLEEDFFKEVDFFELALRVTGFNTVALKLADFKLTALDTVFFAAMVLAEANFLLAVFKVDIALN